MDNVNTATTEDTTQTTAGDTAEENANKDNLAQENPPADTNAADAENGNTSSESPAWEETFPGKSPEDVKDELKTWVKHSRDWEKRAKDWKKQLESTPSEANNELNVKFNEVQSENLMFRDLIALEIEHGERVPISDLADSIAFRDAYSALDRDDDDFADKLQSIVEKRTVKQSFPSSRKTETYAPDSTGADLYDRLYNSK